MGTAIRKNIPFVLHAPVVTHDPLDPAPLPLLDATSHAAFASANVMTQYLRWIKLVEMKQSCVLSSNHLSLTKDDPPLHSDIDNDSFAMYKIARDSQACSTS